MSHEPTNETSRGPDSTGHEAATTPPWRAADATAVPGTGAVQVDVPDAGLPESPNEYPWSGWRPDEEFEEGDELPEKCA